MDTKYIEVERHEYEEKLNRVELAARGVKFLGRVEGKLVLYTVMNEAKNRFDREADKMLDRLVEEFDND